MKRWKLICLLVGYPLLLMCIGFLCGMLVRDNAILRGRNEDTDSGQSAEAAGGLWENDADVNLPESILPVGEDTGTESGEVGKTGDVDAVSSGGLWDAAGVAAGDTTEDTAGAVAEETAGVAAEDSVSAAGGDAAEDVSSDQQEVAYFAVKLRAETEYVLRETDLKTQTTVETVWALPAEYIGMTREEFLEAMEAYVASPPEEELARGFVSLQVLSFSVSRVVVQTSYDPPLSATGFYLVVEDNYLVVYPEDSETAYLYTEICLLDLPEDVQQEVIGRLYVPDEEALYNFLETYTS